MHSSLCFLQGVIIEKEEQERQKRHADQADDRIEAILNKVQSLEKSIIKLMEALKIKSWNFLLHIS